MPVKAKARRVQLKLSTEGEIEVARVTLEVLERQARAGVSSTGASFGIGKTKSRIDLHDTGRLFSDVVIFPSRLSFRAPYAGYVADRYEFQSIAPGFVAEYETLLRQALALGLRAEV